MFPVRVVKVNLLADLFRRTFPKKGTRTNCITSSLTSVPNMHDPEKYGSPFISDLTNLFWYIDGHHDVFSSRSCSIPLLFANFTGYNKQELSKHRKRSISNMSRDKLLEYASTLQQHATSSWMEQPHWATFKSSFVALIESLSSYASYLSIRNKAMKLNHSSVIPHTQFSDATSVRYFIKSPSAVSPFLAHLDESLSSSGMYKKSMLMIFAQKRKGGNISSYES